MLPIDAIQQLGEHKKNLIFPLVKGGSRGISPSRPFSLYPFEKMTIKTTITNLTDAMLLLEQLENPDYLEANGISPEEVPELQAYAQELVAKSQSEAQPFIEWRLRQRQDSAIFVAGLEAEIKRLQELKQAHEKKIASTDKQVDYLLKLFQIEKLRTELYELSYRKSEAVVLTDESLVPAEFKKEKVSISVDKVELKKALKSWLEIAGASLEIRKNLQIK